MVELTRARGVDARVGDVQALLFPDESFDCALSGWMLYHVPDVDRALAELARVLRPGGRLVATTYATDNYLELWDLVGRDPTSARHSFREDTGEEALRRRFSRVERRNVEAITVFPNPQTARDFIFSTIEWRHLADRVPDFDRPLRARNHQIVFVAEKAA